MVSSFSVIIPAYNCEKVVTKTIESIIESIDYFYANCDRPEEVKSEIIVVNDCSTDNTLYFMSQFVGKKNPFKIINHPQGRGAGATRNTGVKNSQGEILFFCDGDDLYLPEHIYVCFMSLNYDPDSSNSDGSFALGDRTIQLPKNRLDGIRTGVKIKGRINPNWKLAVENSLTINLCLRRECHEFIEEYPEDLVYKQIGGREDCAYQKYLSRFFNIGKIPIETVEYIRYPGNSLDRQIIQSETGQGRPEEEKKLHVLASQREQEKIAHLINKLNQLAAKEKEKFYFPKAEKLRIKVQDREVLFLHPPTIGDAILNVFYGKDYPIIHLPNYQPTTIIDVGANVGATALYFCNAYPQSKIYCYEPSPENFTYLKENTKNFDRIQVFPYGLFDRDKKEVTLYKGADNLATVMASQSASNMTESIQLVQTAKEMQRLNLQNISILKINTAGCEVPILKELMTVVENIDILYLEYYSESDRCEIEQTLDQKLLLSNMHAERVHQGKCIYLNKNLVDRYPEIQNQRIQRISL